MLEVCNLVVLARDSRAGGFYLIIVIFILMQDIVFVISRGAEGPGREILQHPPSVCPSGVRHV